MSPVLYSKAVRHFATTKMLRKGRASLDRPATEQSRFTMAKAMVLASTDFQQRNGINAAASYLMDGHSVDLSKELVEQKPSIVRSEEWNTAAPIAEEPKPAPSQAAPGIIRVCWQCPPRSQALSGRFASQLSE